MRSCFSFCTNPRLLRLFAFVHILACIHSLTTLTELGQWLGLECESALKFVRSGSTDLEGHQNNALPLQPKRRRPGELQGLAFKEAGVGVRLVD